MFESERGSGWSGAVVVLLALLVVAGSAVAFYFGWAAPQPATRGAPDPAGSHGAPPVPGPAVEPRIALPPTEQIPLGPVPEPPLPPPQDPPAPPALPAPVPVPGPAPAAAGDPAAVTWEKINETKFTGRVAWDKFHPYYVIDASPIGMHDQSEKIMWNYYGDEDPIEYHPDKEALIDSSRVIDRSVRLAKQAPHTLRWELTFSGGPNVGLEADGVVLGNRTDPDDFPVDAVAEHKLVLTRAGELLTLTVDGAGPHTVKIPADDRTPLRVTGMTNPFVIRAATLSFGNGEKLSPPPERKPGEHPVRWVEVLHEDFSKPESVKLFVVHPADGRLAWNKEAQALDFGPENPEAQPDQAYVLLHRSLPGDVRVSFRARGVNKFRPFFGLLVNLKGTLKKEEAYFIEWNYWQVQMKKKNARQAGKETGYGVEKRDDWVKFRFEKIGDTLVMYTQGQEVLRWVDPHPYADPDHDLFCFYSWHVPNQIDDLVIERNALDPVNPRADDPATTAHYLDGNRAEPNTPPPAANDEF